MFKSLNVSNLFSHRLTVYHGWHSLRQRASDSLLQSNQHDGLCFSPVLRLLTTGKGAKHPCSQDGLDLEILGYLLCHHLRTHRRSYNFLQAKIKRIIDICKKRGTFLSSEVPEFHSSLAELYHKLAACSRLLPITYHSAPTLSGSFVGTCRR